MVEGLSGGIDGGVKAAVMMASHSVDSNEWHSNWQGA